MIAFLTGTVAGKGAGYCLLDVGGIGYRLAMATGALSAMPALGDSVTVYTHLHVREDELSLFGFESDAEKTVFEQLITVSGVGPKVALAALSTLSAQALALAIASEDVAAISGVPGIGKKTAQRIILDLKDKVVGDLGEGAQGPSSATALAEATDALLAMGFTSAEASAALVGAEASGDAQALLRYALVRLGGSR